MTYRKTHLEPHSNKTRLNVAAQDLRDRVIFF